jgi:hypothetical protein
MNTGKFRMPGAFSLTAIRLRSQDEAAELERLSSDVLRELGSMPGFISAVLTGVGLTGHTITAWEDAEAPKQLMRGGAHREAIDRFFGKEFAAGGMTSVWVPSRINASWIRCGSCHQMVNYDQAPAQKCRCGALLPERFPYW